MHIIRGHPPFFVEFLAPGVCKGTGLVELCRHLDIDVAELVAFGDGDNDKEYLQFAGLGVAMHNARDVVKDVADYVTPYTNDDDGVVRELDRLRGESRLTPDAEWTRQTLVAVSTVSPASPLSST